MSSLWAQYQDWWAQWGLQSNWLALALPAVLAAVAAEITWSAARGGGVYRWPHTVADLTNYTAHYAIEFAGYFLLVAPAHAWVWQHRVFTIPDTAASWAALFVLNDIIYYGWHRLHHRVAWAWAAHSVHHSVEHLNLLAAYRKSPFYLFTFGWTLWLPLTWLGFNPYSTGYLFALNLTLQVFLHTRAVGTLGPLEWIFNTPSHHRVHHARNAGYLDRNFGGVFIVWDRLFGTFAAERAGEPCDFGLTAPPPAHDAATLATFSWLRLFDKMAQAQPLGRRLRLLWTPP